MTKIAPERKEAAKQQLEQFRIAVRYNTRDYPIELIVDKFQRGDFFVPDYQRKFIWPNKDKCYFIESVLMGLPIPFMFWGECEDGKMEIVDGVQRINTLVAFVQNRFKLSGLMKLTALNGFFFSDLSSAQQSKFLNNALRIIVLASETTDALRQDIFSRVNRSGKTTTDSEFRRGTYPGRLTSYIDRCQKDDLFRRICPLSKTKELRHEGFELILRFFAFVNNYLDFRHDVGPFLDEFLLNNQDSFDELAYTQEFKSMCAFVERHFPDGFAKEGVRQVPRVRFEAISVGVALALRENSNLDVESVDWLNSDDFKELTTSDASNNPGRLKERVEYVRDMLLGREQNDCDNSNF